MSCCFTLRLCKASLFSRLRQSWAYACHGIAGRCLPGLPAPCNMPMCICAGVMPSDLQRMADTAAATALAAHRASRKATTRKVVSCTPSGPKSSVVHHIQREKGIHIVPCCLLPAEVPAGPRVPRFTWSHSETEVQATPRAAAHLQQHFAPDSVRILAVPGHVWLRELGVNVGESHRYTLRQGKSDLIMYCDNATSHSMLDQLQALLERDAAAARQLHDPESSQAAQQGIKRASNRQPVEAGRLSRSSAAGGPRDTAQLLRQLLSFVVGIYKLKSHAALQTNFHLAMEQATAKHMQLAFTVSIPRASRQHPGCLLVMGDLNQNHIWLPIQPRAISRPVDQIDAWDADDGDILSDAAQYIKNRLHKLASSPSMLNINRVPGKLYHPASTSALCLLHPI